MSRWDWVDISDDVQPQDAQLTLTMHLDNHGALFAPKPQRVFVVIGGVRHGPYEVASLSDAAPAIAAAHRRHRRLSRMRAAYRARRR
jgi:hypothetical protein